ncbi:MAG TPA: tetratricopeptide repeat protein [Polyangiaceae bacterium]|nr:tetratricopeptide repeat protein [Polyangiaceae bacterium]
MTSRKFPALALFLACVGCATTRPPAAAAGSSGDVDPLQRQPPEALFERGEQSAARGDTVRAEQYLQLAIDKGYDRRRALPVLLSVCLSSGRLRAALNYAEPELRLRPDDAELRYLVASIHLGLGQRDEARGELEQLLRSHPNQSAALYLLGVIEADDFGEPALARGYFQRYLSKAPRGAHAPEVQNRLSEIDARMAVATSTAAQGSDDNRMPRYVPFVPPAGVATVLMDPPSAIQPDDKGGGWR